MRRAGCEVALDAGRPVVGPWDHARVEHMVSALVAVAIRSGGGTPVAIAVRRSDRGEGEVEVRWGGDGIAGTQLALVQGEFEAAVTRAAPGANILALWLAARVAQAHGGRLELEATRGLLALPLQR